MARTRQKKYKSLVSMDCEKSDNDVIEENIRTGEQFEQQLDEDLPHFKSNTSLTVNAENNYEIKDDSNNSKTIYFIGSQSEEPLMKRAFILIVEELHHLTKREIDFNQLKKIESIDNNLFVINSFSGQLFDYLVERKARIIGPLVILFRYLTHLKISFDSITRKPLFSECMKGLVVCVSGFDESTKLEFILKIRRMSGTFSKDLTTNVTHLVTDLVISKKYKMAKCIGIPVVTSDWIHVCWDRYQHELLPAYLTNIIDIYTTSLFKNLIITVSQVEERDNIKEIVTNNGGVYENTLKLNQKNVLLLLKEPKGMKFEFASKAKIPCLDIKWLYDSIEMGYALPEDQYIIAPLSQDCNFQCLQSCSVHNNNNTKPRSSLQNNSRFASNHRINKIFGMPLTICEESKQTLEKWEKASEMHKFKNHKSLGDDWKETFPIEWCDQNIDELNDQKNIQLKNEENHERSPEIIENIDNDFEMIIENSDSPKTTENSVYRGFMFSGFDQKWKQEFTRIVENLKGFVIESEFVDERVTHIIINEPKTTLKLLSAIASGIWILKDSYLFESLSNCAFINEHQFEWGFILSNSDSQRKTSSEKLVINAIELKKKVREENVGNRKIFDNWSVLMISKTKLSNAFTTILECGSARVTQYSNDLNIENNHLLQFDFAFIDQKETQNLDKSRPQIEKLLAERNKLFRLDFVVNYMINWPNVDLKKYEIRENEEII